MTPPQAPLLKLVLVQRQDRPSGPLVLHDCLILDEKTDAVVGRLPITDFSPSGSFRQPTRVDLTMYGHHVEVIVDS